MIDKTMKAIVYRHYAKPPAFEMTDIAVPRPEPDEVLVAVHAAGLNQMDLKTASGAFRMLTGRNFPKQIGADFSGVVVECGERVDGLVVGDPVYGYIVDIKGKRGTFAQYIAVKPHLIASKPVTLSYSLAAAMPCVYQTALQGLRDAGGLERGQSVLIYGASGGVSTAAIQLARHMGAHVTSVSSHRNRDHCLDNGAHIALAYDEGSVWERLDRRFDLIFQVFETRENLFVPARHHLTAKGRFIVSPNPGLLFRNLGALLRGRFRMFAVKGNTKDLALIAALTDQGELRPTVSVVAFDRFQDAFARIAGFKGTGKTVLDIEAEQ